MRDSVRYFFRDKIKQEIDHAKERLAVGACTTLVEYQYEVARIRTLQESEEYLDEAIKLSQSANEDD